MLSLPFGSALRQVLCLGAHCDDIEIGCSGALMTLACKHPKITFTLVVFASDEGRRRETESAVRRLFPEDAQVDLQVLEFRDGFFPAHWSEIKDCLEAIKRSCSPDLVLTHYEHDRHQDHRIISELAWNTFRDHLILEYEIPKYDGDLGRPNVYFPLASDIATRKTNALLESFPSQAGKRWFTADLFQGFMRIRGMECNSESGFAEAFYARKLRLQP